MLAKPNANKVTKCAGGAGGAAKKSYEKKSYQRVAGDVRLHRHQLIPRNSTDQSMSPPPPPPLLYTKLTNLLQAILLHPQAWDVLSPGDQAELRAMIYHDLPAYRLLKCCLSRTSSREISVNAAAQVAQLTRPRTSIFHRVATLQQTPADLFLSCLVLSEYLQTAIKWQTTSIIGQHGSPWPSRWVVSLAASAVVFLAYRSHVLRKLEVLQGQERTPPGRRGAPSLNSDCFVGSASHLQQDDELPDYGFCSPAQAKSLYKWAIRVQPPNTSPEDEEAGYSSTSAKNVGNNAKATKSNHRTVHARVLCLFCHKRRLYLFISDLVTEIIKAMTSYHYRIRGLLSLCRRRCRHFVLREEYYHRFFPPTVPSPATPPFANLSSASTAPPSPPSTESSEMSPLPSQACSSLGALKIAYREGTCDIVRSRLRRPNVYVYQHMARHYNGKDIKAVTGWLRKEVKEKEKDKLMCQKRRRQKRRHRRPPAYSGSSVTSCNANTSSWGPWLLVLRRECVPSKDYVCLRPSARGRPQTIKPHYPINLPSCMYLVVQNANVNVYVLAINFPAMSPASSAVWYLPLEIHQRTEPSFYDPLIQPSVLGLIPSASTTVAALVTLLLGRIVPTGTMISAPLPVGGPGIDLII
ncbi:hypothetical protein CONLIGDRAFT_647072 [Coniochaeta ligniaria NRRL 30616]|uniref:Uncharacterized protein n=1 Tax=Coniochaeta ligniaria NRRL 30616 TaxID=1408157 RepID=A0A1J7IHS0_9PEZI|nr:hypothetical protein CONLIGDRAFT_647072 [Coniochaeta ligniaria NRRL 30616]